MSPLPSSSPLVHRRRLRAELRRARAGVNLTQEQVAEAMEWSLSKVIRIENGNVSISASDLRGLFGLYQISDRERMDYLLELARASRQPSWFSRYKEVVTPQYVQYMEYEEAATILRTYHPISLPGLLQTEEYARAIIRKLAPPGSTADDIRTRVSIRMRRQQLLEQTTPPTLICVLDEAVIQHVLGERNFAEEQIARLIDLANRPNITIEIIPYSAGLYRGMLEAFLHLEFPDPEDGDLVFVEGPTRDTLISNESADEIADFRELFEDVRNLSMGPERTSTYLANLTK